MKVHIAAVQTLLKSAFSEDHRTASWAACAAWTMYLWVWTTDAGLHCLKKEREREREREKKQRTSNPIRKALGPFA